METHAKRHTQIVYIFAFFYIIFFFVFGKRRVTYTHVHIAESTRISFGKFVHKQDL